jgi:adenosylcobinamide kinase/adenosylcobinamide-phosphate guanylyltransferase
MQQKLILIGGGARSGKSTFAVAYARKLGLRRLFVATAEPSDEEMSERIVRHRTERGQDFVTIEEPLHLPQLLRDHHGADVVVVDCLTLWLCNLLLHEDSSASIWNEVEALADVLAQRRQHVLLVSNEVGMGIVPGSALGRTFRDLAGKTHQRLAAQADEVYFATMGLLLRLVPEPATTFRQGVVP